MNSSTLNAFLVLRQKELFFQAVEVGGGDRKVGGSTRLTFVFGELRYTGKFLCRSAQEGENEML